MGRLADTCGCAHCRPRDRRLLALALRLRLRRVRRRSHRDELRGSALSEWTNGFTTAQRGHRSWELALTNRSGVETVSARLRDRRLPGGLTRRVAPPRPSARARGGRSPFGLQPFRLFARVEARSLRTAAPTTSSHPGRRGARRGRLRTARLEVPPAVTRLEAAAAPGRLEGTSRIEPTLTRAAVAFVARDVEVRCWSVQDWTQVTREENAFTAGEITVENTGAFASPSDGRMHSRPPTATTSSPWRRDRTGPTTRTRAGSSSCSRTSCSTSSPSRATRPRRSVRRSRPPDASALCSASRRRPRGGCCVTTWLRSTTSSRRNTDRPNAATAARSTSTRAERTGRRR